MSAPAPALVVSGLRVTLRGTDIDIVDDISFSIQPGEVLGLVADGIARAAIGIDRTRGGE